ncbi:exo-alpha-sialidase [Endozoicomonas elysicola]|uniref:exo-alpha-sialidase n=1 Tax=Endozoicomonas elysicola TaxID=305900 RepID=A0A081KGM9_9GAMM|nr:exo-alpha-sialidase [Endozoicomonas elysicola]KEI73305.1 hypothetical protein GV64_23595 [Endozoicomonas elysicola]
MYKKTILAACIAAVLPLMVGCDNDDDNVTNPPTPIPPPVESVDLAFNAESDSSPIAQGWSGNLSGPAYGELVEETLADGTTVLAWYVNGLEGIAEWKATPEGEFNAMASQNGWTMAFTMRVESGSYLTNYYGNGVKRFLPVLKLDGNNLVVELEGDQAYTLVEGDLEAAMGYHNYVISFDPATGKATYQFDDKIITSDWQGSESAHNVVAWGNGSSSTSGASEAFYQSFTFDIPGYEFTPSFKLFKAGSEQGEDATNAYRIPALQSAVGDYVFAFAEGRPGGADPGQAGEIVMSAKFSTDGGENWSEVENISKSLEPGEMYDFSDPRPIYNEQTGELTIVYTQWPTHCAQNGDCIQPDGENKLFFQKFNMNSKTWEAPVDITAQVRERAWDARGWSGKAAWSFDITDALQTPAAGNWSLVTDRKAIQGQITDYLVTGEAILLPTVTVTEANNLVVNLNGTGGGDFTLLEDVGPAEFHTSEIRYDPVTKTASYLFDGEVIASNWSGAPNSAKKVVFGNDLTNDEGRATYKSANFTIGETTVIDYSASATPAAEATPVAQGWTAELAEKGRGILGWKSTNAGPGNGIQLKWQTIDQGNHNGRMILPSIILDGFGELDVQSVYSDDNGETWKSGARALMPYDMSGNNIQQVQPSESDLVELTDGRLLLTTRNDGHGNYGGVFYGPRIQFISNNGGETWVYDANSTLPKNIDEVDASLIRYSGSPTDDNTMLLFSAPIGNTPGDKKRTNLGIWSSTDEGATWNGPKQVWTGDSWYSDMTMMPDGKVGILVETGGYSISLLKKDISELLPEAQPQP